MKKNSLCDLNLNVGFVAFVMLFFTLSEQSQAQTISIGPNQYAFQLTANMNYGLFFNASDQRYEFLNGNAQPVLGFNANTGRFSTDLEFLSDADYLVGNNRYAFRSKSIPNYGLYFNASQLQYEFRNSAANPVFALSAESGELDLDAGLKIGNSTSNDAGMMRWNGDLEVYDGSDWTSLTAGGVPGPPGPSSLQAAYDGGNTIDASNGAMGISGTDGFVVSGNPGAGALANQGAGTHMFFNPRKAAFRAGTVSDNAWDDASLGEHSVGMGENVVASGDNSAALGFGITAPSAFEIVLGSFNTLYTPASTNAWNASDRLFTVGNGTSFLSRKNAMVILKNGRVGFGTSNPAAPLDVQVGTSSVRLGSASSSSKTRLTFNDSANQRSLIEKLDDGTLGIKLGNSLSPQFNFTPNGRMGIGTSDPAQAIEVAGSILAITSNYAIRGIKTGNGTFPGVWGETESTSTNASGVRGFVLADSPGSGAAGVYGHVFATTTNGYGVKGTHDGNGSGVYGETNNGTGVLGRVNGNSSTATGVKGVHSSGVSGELGMQSRGVRGEHTNGNYGILANSLHGVLGVSGSFTGAGVIGIHQGGGWAGNFIGNVTVSGLFSNPSDAKLKTNIQDLDRALLRLSQLAPKTYDFRTDEYHWMHLPSGTQFGLISQDVEKVFPELVVESVHPEIDLAEEDLYQEEVHYSGLNYIGFIPIIIGAINELEKRTASMDADRLAALESIVQDQNEVIAAQKAQIEELMAVSRDLIKRNDRFDQDLQNCCFGQDSEKASISDNTDLPELGLNIPNPFRESTVIHYYLPAGAAQSMIRVSTVEGIPVKDFNLGSLRGHNQVEFYTNGLAAGTYLYSLFVNSELVSSRRMVVSK